jgi:PAS domain S-box-containing protein
VIWGSLTVTSTYDSNGQFLYFLGIIEDVTPRKQAEDALRERENKLSTILNLLPVGISILDENQQIVYENEALERILGITREGLERGDYRNRKYLRNDGTEKPAEEFASARAFHEKKAIYNFVTGIVKEDGQTTWTNVSAVPVDFPDWKVVLVTGDITELKQTEKALEKSKNLLTETESMGKVGGWEFNIDTLEQNWTDEVYRIHEVDLNFKQDVNKGINFYAPSSRPIIEQAVERILIFGEPFDLELEIITAKGNLRKVHTIGKADFENRRIYGFFQDITERKRVEEEVKKLNDRISTATRASQVGIWDWDIQNNALFWDDQMYALYGLKNDEFTGAFEAWVNGLHPNDREFSTEQTQMALAGEKDYDTEFRVVWPDGTIRYCKAKGEVFRNEKGEPIRMVGVNYDITERKLIEKELQESEEYLKLGYETANLGIWKNDLNTMTVEFDERARSHYGFEESVVMLSDVIARIHPDDLGRLVAQIEKATAPTGSGRYSTEYRVIHPDGSVRWLHIGVRVIYEGEGENRRSVMGFGTSLDITERKQREETLLKLEYFLSEGQKIAHVGSFEYVVETQTTNWSAEEYAIYGLDPAEPSPPYEVMLAKCIHPDDADLLNQTFGAALQSHSVYELEHRIIRPDGSIRWVFDRAKPYFDQSGKLVRYVGATLDITQRKLAEEALKKSENEFRLLAEAMPQIVWITRPDGWNIYFNQQWVDYTGLTLEESYGNGWNKPFHPDDQQRAWEAWQNAVNNNGIYSLECRLRRFDGVYKWWLIRGIPIMDSNCVIQKWFGTCTDINELKQAEFELQESKQKLDTALSSMTDAIFISDLDGNFIEFNDAFATFHKFRNKEDCAKTLAEYPEFLEVYLPTGELASIDQWAVPRALRGEVVKNAEYTLRRKDTGETWIGSYSFSPICDENSTITGSVVTARDITEQKLADEKIRQKDQEFRKLSANVPDLLFQFTRRPDGSYFVPIASEGIRNIFGCAPEDVIDDFTPIGRVIHPEDAERVIRDIEYSAEHMTYFTCEFRVQIPGREIQWIYSKSTPERLPDGSITWYGFNTDITHRKQFEKTLRESEEKFRRAFATNPDAITITRLSDGVYVSVNNGFTQAFGYTEEEIKGKTSLEINMWCNPEDRKVFVDELTTKGLVENFEARLYTKGGETIDTLVSATMLDFEGQPHILSTTKDITERKRVEVALKESEEKFRGLIESIPLPVTYVNNAGEIIFRNDRFVELIGYSQDEIPTVNEWWLVAYPDKTYREWVIRNWESALEHAKKTNSDILPKEYRIVCKDGRQRTFVVSGILIDDNLLITFVDVTDRKEAEDEIRKLNETLEQRVTDRTRQLQEANSELEAFSYSVSHDLRAPLRHINGFIDLVTENYGDLLPDKGRHYLDVIVSSSRHMGTLIDDLLQFSRTGRQEMQEADLNMNVLLQDVLFQMKHDTDSRDIVWTIADLPGIKGDQALLRMVWYNLLGNAIKFTKAKDPAKIQVGCSENENEYTFYVRDNGAGFDMRYAHKLFGVFQRLHTTKEFEGTGIGLANVRRIILKHGGRTWAEGQLNEGASFYFTLPKPKTITQ